MKILRKNEKNSLSLQKTKINKETIKEKRQNFEERLKRNLKRISEKRMVEEEIENTGKWKG